jgi:hypothetical protein
MSLGTVYTRSLLFKDFHNIFKYSSMSRDTSVSKVVG